MLTVGALPSLLHGSQGQYVSASAQFNSDTVLTGTVLTASTGQFVSNARPSGSVTAWQIIYPTVPGTYAMAYTLPDVRRNHTVSITVIDAQTFSIDVDLILKSDYNAYEENYVPDNNDPFELSGVFTGSSKFLGIRVQSGSNRSTQYVPVNVRAFCEEQVSFQFSEDTSGIIDVNVTIDGIANSTFFAGLYNTSVATNGSAFPDDTGFNYAGINNGPYPVADFDSACIVGGAGFVGSGANSTALIRLDENCLTDGAYRLYVVYQIGGQWHSCEYDGFLGPINERRATVGDFTCTIDDGLGNIYDECCVSNLPTCASPTVCVSPDVGSFNDIYVSSGQGGVFGDYFDGVTAFVLDSIPSNPSNINGAPISVTMDGFSACATYSPPSGFSGVKYILFRYQMGYFGSLDFLNIVTQLSFNGSTESIDFTATYPDGSVVGNFICAESEGPITITYDATNYGTCELSQSLDGGAATAANVVSYVPGTIIVDVSDIPVGSQLCYQLCCISSATPTPCDCSYCEPISYQFQQDTCSFAEGQSQGTVNFSFSLSGVLSSEVSDVLIETSTGETFSGTTAALNGSFVVPYSNPVNVGYIAIIELVNGCVYTLPPVFLQTVGSDESTACVATQSGQSSATDCDCSTDEDTCNSFAAIVPNCSDGVIDFTTTQSLNNPVDTDTLECSIDGTTYGPCSLPFTGPELFVRRTISFTDGCPDLVVNQYIDCVTDAICNNSINLAIAVNGNTVTLVATGNYSSIPTSEFVYYSTDNGATFFPYTSPFNVSANTTVIAYAEATFADGCPIVTSATITEVVGTCDYSGFSVECSFNEATQLFTATFIGPNVPLITDVRIYSPDGSQPTIPYTVPATASVFLVNWTIAILGCDPITLSSACCANTVPPDCFNAGVGTIQAAC